MLAKIKAPVYTIKEATTYCWLGEKANNFPLYSIDRDSYIVSADVLSGIDFDWKNGVHNLQIGRHCAVGEDILFVIDTNHDYGSVSQGCISGITDVGGQKPHKIKRKGQIIIENDCWIAHGVTIMNGVTIHNGAVVATNAVVTKDVPPYAIVGGNPAKIIKYRFPKETIDELLNIAWWDWDLNKIVANKDLITGDVNAFINHFKQELPTPDISQPFFQRLTQGKRYVFYLDLNAPYPTWRRVISEWIERFQGTDNELMLIGKSREVREAGYQEAFEDFLQLLAQYEKYEVYIDIYDETMHDDTDVLWSADYYITNRDPLNIRRMCKAELYGVEVISGVDLPIF